MFYGGGKYNGPGDARKMGSKRQRLMDHQASTYYSTPGMNYTTYNAPPAAPTPPPQYSYFPPPFPVVRLRGLPFDCSEAEIVDFFHGLDVIDVLFTHKGGKFTGEAYCVLGYPLQIDFALQRNRQNIGRRYVEVFRSRKDEYYKAIANEVFDAPGGSPRRGSSRARSFDETRDLSEFKGVLKLRGLPYSATKEEIVEFFEGFALTEDKIHLIANSEGRPAGEAFVEFASPEESRAAMSKDRMKLKYRYIELFPASHEELDESASRGRLLPKSYVDDKDSAEPTSVLRMRGLPFSAGKEEIMDFFKNFTLSEDSIHITFNYEGRPTGEAFVEFSSEDDGKAALAKDRMTLGSRYIELFPSSFDEMRESTSRERSRTRSTRSNSSRRRRRTLLKNKHLPNSKNQETFAVSPVKLFLALPKAHSSENLENKVDIMSCDNISTACSTPKAKRYQIPEIKTCPPPPKKQRIVTSTSTCSLRRKLAMDFFAPPDIDLFFYFALRGIQV